MMSKCITKTNCITPVQNDVESVGICAFLWIYTLYQYNITFNNTGKLSVILFLKKIRNAQQLIENYNIMFHIVK